MFIISSAFRRTNSLKDPVERVHETFDEVGMSIVMTTTSTSLTFGLGCLSKIPAMKWLSFYAFPSVLFVTAFQLTFFVAICVLDAKRIKSNRRDGCFCFKVHDCTSGAFDDASGRRAGFSGSIAQQRMKRYAKVLFHPFFKCLVLISFSALTVVCAISATKLENEFKVSEVVPQDSYILRFMSSMNAYGFRGNALPVAYFRGVDQSDEAVQIEMENFINDLVSLRQIDHQPPFFWLRDFKEFVNSTASLRDLPFTEQLDLFLQDPGYRRTYGSSIVLDEQGNIASSRCVLYMTNLDMDNTSDQINALEDQRWVSASQRMNEGQQSWDFFTYDDSNYYIWEFYNTAGKELVTTTVGGIIAVTGLAIIFIPHWTAALFVFPMITVLCVDLLGMWLSFLRNDFLWYISLAYFAFERSFLGLLRFCGVTVNAVSYMAVMMSIGLLVDFIMHLLLRFLESNEETREEKARDALQSMGSSLLLGGLSTFLGIMPLAFSTSKLLSTVFTAFVLMIILGLSHGLILLPVLLSLVGPSECVQLDRSHYAHKESFEGDKKRCQSTISANSVCSVSKSMDIVTTVTSESTCIGLP